MIQNVDLLIFILFFRSVTSYGKLVWIFCCVLILNDDKQKSQWRICTYIFFHSGYDKIVTVVLFYFLFILV